MCGTSSLRLTVLEGHEEAVRVLLGDERTDPNLLDSLWQALLHAAVGWSRKSGEVLRLLVADERVDVNWMDPAGVPPLSQAGVGWDEPAVRLKLSRKDVELDKMTLSTDRVYFMDLGIFELLAHHLVSKGKGSAVPYLRGVLEAPQCVLDSAK
ncbi:hypothetical protein L873DRAFT_1844832 [Choiromyces venosus 120613-1]|uniref:Uncharacterized protein n=1 Tax=Choiromyces venosus 120613-1 TaxID=1336337 RepID=A0A3N4JJ72_9PEZI|nr:hypothetical protein L873DRAFT_1844832 [Choiromyces venosus 120613-1]